MTGPEHTVREALRLTGQPEMIYTSALSQANLAALAALDELVAERDRLRKWIDAAPPELAKSEWLPVLDWLHKRPT